jgi:penicillin-binding protein 1A
MKPIVYLAAFLHGPFTLDSMVPDEPIIVPDRDHPEGKAISNYDGQFKGMIPLRVALAESRNAVAIWIAEQIGISNVLRTARELGIQSQLQPWETTALGASEVTLLELANAYRTIATGTYSSPHLIRQVSRGASVVDAVYQDRGAPQFVNADALALIQEGLRGVVRLPSGTAHALDWPGLPVMGKTGTTSQYRDALFVGSTFGAEGITIAVRIGFDDNRSLGPGETGGRAALPIFREIVTKSYAGERIREVPKFPAEIEERITQFLQPPPYAPLETSGQSDGLPD